MNTAGVSWPASRAALLAPALGMPFGWPESGAGHGFADPLPATGDGTWAPGPTGRKPASIGLWKIEANS
jgi:hypothetical protein